ncbi:MAG: hypothetical protein WB677_10540, partial [Xanthobacteraceae bacterium]
QIGDGAVILAVVSVFGRRVEGGGRSLRRCCQALIIVRAAANGLRVTGIVTRRRIVGSGPRDWYCTGDHAPRYKPS